MKKILAFFITIIMLIMLVACTGTPTGNEMSNNEISGNTQPSSSIGDDDVNDATTTEDNVNLVRGTKGDGTLTVVEMSNGYEVTLTHPEIIKKNLANEIIDGIEIEFSFEDDSEKIILMIDNEFDPEVRYLELDDNGSATLDEFYYADYYIEDASIVFLTQESPIDIATAKKVTAKIWSEDDSKEYYKSFDLAEVFNPYTGDTTLVVGEALYESEVAFDNVIGDVSLTIKEQYDSYHITLTHPSYMKNFIDGQEIVFNVKFRNDNTTDPDEISLSYSSYESGEINSNYNSKSAGSTFYDSKNVEYTIDEYSLTWYLPKSYEFNPSEMYRYVVGIHSDSFNNYESLYSEFFVKSYCYIPYDDSVISTANPEELTIFDGHWTRPDGYIATSVQSIDSIMVDSESGTWAEYNEFAFYTDSLPCYANDGDITLLMSLTGELILTEQNGNLVDSEGDVQYIKAEAPNRDDIVNELLGNWVLNPDMGFSTLVFSENGEMQQLSRSGEVAYTGTWSLVEMEFTHEDNRAIVDTPFIKIDIGDDTVKGYYSILGSKALSRGTMFYFIQEDAMEDTFTRNIVNLTAQQWGSEYEDDIGTHRATLRFEDKIDRRVTLLIQSHLKSNGSHPYTFTVEGTWTLVDDDVLRITFNDGTYEDIQFDGTSFEVKRYDLEFD